MAREMKDSGIEGFPLIPFNWSVEPLKANFEFGKGLPITKENLQEDGEPVISYGQIHAKFNTGTTTHPELLRFVSPNYIDTNPQSLTKKGDYIFADTSEDTEGCGNCAYIDTNSPIFAGYHTIIAHPKKETIGKYFAYLFKTDCWRNQIRCRVAGIKLYSITLKILTHNKIVIPPFSEQQRIAAYLDEKCADIDNLVSVEEGMIEELQAYKQSVITEAVTKGLDSDVPMKDSGVEWISSIPATWAVEPLKANVEFGKGLPITKEDLREEGEPVISYGQIHAKFNTGTTTHPELLRFVSSSFVETNSQSLTKRGDFIFADTSEDTGGCGNCVYIDTDYPIFAGYHTIIAHPKNKKIGKYFAYLFRTDYWRNQIRCRVAGIKLFSITLKILAHNTVIIPPAQEQQRIAAYLDEKCADIDDLIAIKRQKIEELKEYKKSLIYEAVTGKIDLSA